MTDTDIPPLTNALGEEIGQTAAAGRVTVNPDDVIQSTWGNLTYNQSVNVFLSVTDRDTQWTAPADGAVCYTQAETALWFRRAGAWVPVASPGRLAVTTGGLVSATDASGEIWVAKPGVNGGAWRKARDVLSARRYRTAAFSATTTQAILAMDTQDFDAYGLYVPAQNGFVIPIPGVWLIGFQFAAAFTAGQYARAVVNRNGTIAFQNQLWMNANTSTLPTSGLLALAANDLMQANIQAGATATGDNAAAVTKAENYFTVVYLGTG